MGPNALKYILNVARKSLVKDQGSGIMKVPGRMDAEAKASEIVTSPLEQLIDSHVSVERQSDFIHSLIIIISSLIIYTYYHKLVIMSTKKPQ